MYAHDEMTPFTAERSVESSLILFNQLGHLSLRKALSVLTIKTFSQLCDGLYM